jgi:hypothetical protein
MFVSTYYIDSIKFVGLVLLAACISTLFNKLYSNPRCFWYDTNTISAFKLTPVLCIIFLFLSGLGISLKGWSVAVNKYLKSDLSHKVNDNDIEEKTSILKVLREISKEKEFKSESCLWIPKSNHFFWRNLSSKTDEAFLPFYAVSLSETVLIDGYPLSNSLNGAFGYRIFPRDKHEKVDFKLEQIMKKAKEAGFTKLFVIWNNKSYESYRL